MIDNSKVLTQFRREFSFSLTPPQARQLPGQYALYVKLEQVGYSKRKHHVLIKVEKQAKYVTWKSWDDVKKTIDELTKDMPEGKWTIELENEERAYDEGTYAALTASCYRPATDVEEQIVADYLTETLTAQEARQREQDERMLADLRARRPDLLPTTFVDP